MLGRHNKGKLICPICEIRVCVLPTRIGKLIQRPPRQMCFILGDRVSSAPLLKVGIYGSFPPLSVLSQLFWVLRSFSWAYRLCIYQILFGGSVLPALCLRGDGCSARPEKSGYMFCICAGPPVWCARHQVLSAQQAGRLICTVRAIRFRVLPARYVPRQADLHGMCDQVRGTACTVRATAG